MAVDFFPTKLKSHLGLFKAKMKPVESGVTLWFECKTVNLFLFYGIYCCFTTVMFININRRPMRIQLFCSKHAPESLGVSILIGVIAAWLGWNPAPYRPVPYKIVHSCDSQLKVKFNLLHRRNRVSFVMVNWNKNLQWLCDTGPF